MSLVENLAGRQCSSGGSLEEWYGGSVFDSLFQAIAEGLKTNRHVKKIGLRDNKIGIKGAEARDLALSEAYSS